MGVLHEKKTIVVVEDHEPTAKLLKFALNNEQDYQTAIVLDGALAVDVIRSVSTSLVLLDVCLPNKNGLEIYDLLQEDVATCMIPVIFMTASPDPQEFRKRNIQSFVTKPIDLDELLAQVAKVCRV